MKGRPTDLTVVYGAWRLKPRLQIAKPALQATLEAATKCAWLRFTRNPGGICDVTARTHLPLACEAGFADCSRGFSRQAITLRQSRWRTAHSGP